MTVSTLKATMTLDQSQKSAICGFKEGRSIALIGGAGSGKSFVLHKLLIEAEKQQGGYPHVVACALTNKAANALQGTTIHSLFGAKPSWEFSKEFLWKGIKNRPRILDRLKNIKVLVIDEISLLRSNEIDAIDHVLRELAETKIQASLPFGGRIVIFAGDPFQLEPYDEGNSIQAEARDTAFQSRSWYLTFGPLGDGTVTVLKNNHRQSEDPAFFRILNRIRTGTHSGEDLSLLNGTSESATTPPETHVRLFTTNAQVAGVNRAILSKIPGEIIKLIAQDSYVSYRTESLEARLSTVAPKEIFIKVGARVVLTRKIKDFLPGTQGVIQKIYNFTRTRNNPRFQVDINISSLEDHKAGNKPLRVGSALFEIHGFDREVVASRMQLPLIPSYAMTVHRSQGMTMSHVAIDFSAANQWRPTGLVYVALSRCRTLSGLWIKNLKDNHIRVSPRAFHLMNDIWCLKKYVSHRVCGVNYRSCLGLEDDSDDSDVFSISDEESDNDSLVIVRENIKTSLCKSDGESDNDSVVIVGENITIDLRMNESLSDAQPSESIPHKRFMRGPTVSGKRRCFTWRTTDH